MKKICISLVLIIFVKVVAYAQSTDPKSLIGRWNMTLDVNGKAKPSWMEVKLSGFKTLVGSYVSVAGSARPVAEVKFDNGDFHFEIPPQWESGNQNLKVEGKLTTSGIEGKVTEPNGKTYNWTGVKSPELKRDTLPTWTVPLQLFNGRDLTGWMADGPNQWEVVDGILTNPKAGANLITEQVFDDFKLIVEFRYPKGGNSGIYLRGRYEVQIEDSPKDADPNNILFGGVYGFLTPTEMATLGAGEWQRYEITLIGRKVTIVANGKIIINNLDIPGITGGALDSDEAAPGTIYLQGDHTAVEFRKIEIRKGEY